RQLREGTGNLIELAAQRDDVIELVARRRAIPGGDGAVELIGVLAQPLLAGDRAAFGGRDDLLAQRIELAVELAELVYQRIARRPGLAGLRALLAQAGDARKQRRLVVEQVIDLHSGVVLCLPVGGRPADTPVEPDGQ